MCDVNYKLKIWLTKEIENYELVHVLRNLVWRFFFFFFCLVGWRGGRGLVCLEGNLYSTIFENFGGLVEGKDFTYIKNI